MKRVVSVLAAMAIMATMVAFSAMPAFAASDNSGKCNCVPRFASQGKLGGRAISGAAQEEAGFIGVTASSNSCGVR